MKKLFIIGNGFDLAHNLNTRYSDFMLWYVNKIVRQIGRTHYPKTESDLISIDGNGYKVFEFKSLQEIRDQLTRRLVLVKGKYPFVNDLLSMFSQYIS